MFPFYSNPSSVIRWGPGGWGVKFYYRFCPQKTDTNITCGLQTDFKRVFDERMDEDSLVDSVEDKRMKTWTRRHADVQQVFYVAQRYINRHHARVPAAVN